MNGSFLNPGELEVILGPMKSGKSLGMLLRIAPLLYMNRVKLDIFKPDTDTRDPFLVSRFGKEFNKGMPPQLSYKCTFLPSQDPEKIFDYISEDQQFVGIDEGQFFSKKLAGVVDELLQRNINVRVSGLDTDFRGVPFGAMPELFLRADYREKIKSVCEYELEPGHICGKPAGWTQRLIGGEPAPYDSPIVLVGDIAEGYQARCTAHHEVPGKPQLYTHL